VCRYPRGTENSGHWGYVGAGEGNLPLYPDPGPGKIFWRLLEPGMLGAAMSVMRIDKLVSLPAGLVEQFSQIDPCRAAEIFAVSDPPGRQLGSGGGTAHLLVEAWRASRAKDAPAERGSFRQWLEASAKLLVHGSGESRRLPAYAVEGKPLLPIPSLWAAHARRPGQVLLDLQIQAYERFFWHALPGYRVMVTCGDVLLRNEHWLPSYPQADILIIGITASAEELQHHGAIFCPRESPTKLAFFLQKPPVAQIQELGRTHVSYLDTGVWMLNGRALEVLLKKCGWDPARESFAGGEAGAYELFAEFGLALGAVPAKPEADISDLTSAVLPLPEARFYHFGTNRSLLTSVAQLQSPAAARRSFDHTSMDQTVLQVIQHANVQCPITPQNRHLWIENSHLGPGWTLSQQHILTGVPRNDWSLCLEPGVCLDFMPIENGRICVRFYGFDDPFRGALSDPQTPWLGQPAAAWFQKRGIRFEEAGLQPNTDLQAAPLFPVLSDSEMESGFLQWLLATDPDDNPSHAERWRRQRRLSAQELLRAGNVVVRARQRAAYLRESFVAQTPESWLKNCVDHDLSAAARLCLVQGWQPPAAAEPTEAAPRLALVHDRMFRSALATLQSTKAGHWEAEAFAELRRLIVREMELDPVQPVCDVLEDQIVWGRSPVRLDLAGGWTDTPPYCLEHGGRVVNVAVDLNGQPPIQVFGRISDRPGIRLHSIDLGLEEQVQTYDELRQGGKLGSGFGIARAALALAGLEPSFHAQGGYPSLQEQLQRELGGGIELSLLAAIPKGSGLGASSILAATLLGTLSEMLGLHWTLDDLFARTLALEQMLTSGGGWQDQAGGVANGLKLIETEAAVRQRLVIRWLPGQFFSGSCANQVTLLYYTGLTRVAHDILGEIVKGLFLNSSHHLNILEEIGQNALCAADALQRSHWTDLCLSVRRSWRLNQRLDSGTNPPAVRDILEKIADYVAAAKLLGAGGGGYMLILAKDPEAALRIRSTLTIAPPNPRARFVDLSLSTTGFQVTRS
jgi:galactokinase/mevalonate kinase-like predicted kinase